MRINYNVSAMVANNSLANNDSLLAKSMERLSSGLKINHAKDNPAGLAMGKRMNAQIVGVGVASQNSSDGVSVIETADGALSEVADMLQRMNELAVKGANGTLTTEDRDLIDQEIQQLKDEINRVADATEFNGQKLLDGEYSPKGYANIPGIKVTNYSDTVEIKEFTLANLPITKDDDGIISFDADAFAAGDDFPADAKGAMIDGLLTITGDNGFEMSIDFNDAQFDDAGKLVMPEPLTLDILGIGGMRLQVGANEGQIVEVRIPACNLRNMGIESIDSITADNAGDAIERIDGAIRFVSEVRGQLGAYQNRLESTVDTLNITDENMTAAYSRIMDVDMAEEMTEYTTYQVLTQAGTSMLAQANDRPSQILQLLQ